MIETQTTRKTGETWLLWLIKLVSGFGIVVVLLIHLLVNHLFAAEGLLSHAEVVAYYTNPWIVLMEAVFLIIVVSHSLIGLRSIILDLKPTANVLKVLDVGLSVFGVGAVVYGLWLLQAVVRFI